MHARLILRVCSTRNLIFFYILTHVTLKPAGNFVVKIAQNSSLRRHLDGQMSPTSNDFQAAMSHIIPTKLDF